MKLKFLWPNRKERLTLEEPASAERRKRSSTYSASKTPDLGPEELTFLNDAALDYLRGLSRDEIKSRSDACSVDSLEAASHMEAASKLLEEEGIVIVRNFLDWSQLDSADRAIERLTNALAAASPEQNYEDDEILVQSAERVATSYTAMATHPKTIVTIRRGADAGMVDVFNIDRLAGDQAGALRQPFTSKEILHLLSDGDSPPKAQNLNLYINRGITKTRGFHADTFGKSLKGFVYLSDVNCLDDGPYCFVRQTHVDGPWRIANKKISELAQAKTECPFININMAVPVIAPRGSLILSDQAGIHRGIPQSPGAERLVMVMRYR